MTSTPAPSDSSTPSSPAPPLGTHAAIAETVIGNLVQAASPKVSPDGTQVAFVVTRVDMAKNKYFSQVWLAATDGSTPPRAVTGGERDSQPAWSPDGRSLAFVSARAEKKGQATLHVLPVAEPGETRLVATMKDGVGDVSYSPDGQWIAFTSRTQHERYDAEDESWQAPRKIETFFTKLNGEGWVYDRPSHVYLVAADGTTATPRNLTPGPFQHSGVAWMRDSSGIVTSAARHESWDLDFANDIYRVPLDGSGDVRDLTKQTGLYAMPSVSPDGSSVALLGFDDSTTFPQNMHVAVVPVDGGDHQWISRGLDRTFETTAGAQPAQWLDDHTLVATAEDRGTTHLFRLSTDGDAPVPLTSGPLTVRSFDTKAGTVALAISAVDEVSDVFVLRDGALHRLTHFAERYRATVAPLGWERFTVPTTDGTNEIDAWIMRPAGFDGSQHYPLVLNVHGGPHTQYGETFFDEAQMQAKAGFAVLMCNPRGGSGREQSWGQAIMGPRHHAAPGSGWGTVDVDDVMAVLRAALERYPFLDADRVGMQGGSYGGYMATWLAGTTGTTFKAICSERAVNNLFTEEYTSDISTIFKVEHGPAHIDDFDEYMRMSPIRWVRDIQVPFLIVHSEEDYRCPISQAEELFVAMRLLGKDVTFYRFPGESHELSRSGSPVHRRQRAEIILDFFTHHLASTPR